MGVVYEKAPGIIRARAAVALQAAIEAWPRVKAGVYYYPSAARLAANIARRRPRVKREAGGAP